MDTSQSFTARRSATSSLPNFQLPPPDYPSGKYSSYAPQLQIPQSKPQGIGSVLTPPVGLGGEGISPPSSGVNSGSSGSSLNGVPALYNPSGFWPPPNQTTSQYSFGSGPPMSAPFAQPNSTGMYSARGLYSPSTNSYNGPQRDQNSSATEENLPQPPYQLNLPPFPTSAPPGGSGSTNLPNLPQQQQNQQAHPSQQNPQPQQTTHQQQNMHNSPENYGPRPPPTPTYSYGSSSTPQQSAFPAFSQPSPTQQSPIASGGPASRISPVSGNHPNTMQPPPGSTNWNRPYNGYNLPGLSGQLMQNNLHNPNGPMMVGQIPMQSYPHPGMQTHHMYSMNSGPGATQPNDKPCKCDQCPTSFNRNHDLKRHKRIHMTVKPFPCEDCEKRFSRKDALKVRLISTLPKKASNMVSRDIFSSKVVASLETRTTRLGMHVVLRTRPEPEMTPPRKLRQP